MLNAILKRIFWFFVICIRLWTSPNGIKLIEIDLMLSETLAEFIKWILCHALFLTGYYSCNVYCGFPLFSIDSIVNYICVYRRLYFSQCNIYRICIHCECFIWHYGGIMSGFISPCLLLSDNKCVILVILKHMCDT